MKNKKTYNVGIEVEVDAHPRIQQLFSSQYGIVVHDDGSIRKPHYLFYNYPVSHFNDDTTVLDLFCRRYPAHGTELTTAILPEQVALCFMKDVENRLGLIPPNNPTASIHIHVDVRNEPWSTIYRVLLLFYILEAPFYRMACAGETHRGVANDFLYCRPISHPIGIYKEDTLGLAPCVDISQFLSARTATELLRSWGYLHNIPSGRHYIPHRLMGINLRSVLERGSLEWRIFDGRYQYARSFLQLVLATHRAAEYYSTSYLQQFAQERAWLFGRQHRISIYDVYGILFPDAKSEVPPWLSRLWGTEEMTRFTCQQRVIESHYDGRNRYIVGTSTNVFINNDGAFDTREEDFPLYVYNAGDAPEEDDGDAEEED